MTHTCIICGKPFDRPSRPTATICEDPECRRKRLCLYDSNYRLRRRRPKFCSHCGADITGAKQNFCSDKPECQEARLKKRRAYRREWMRKTPKPVPEKRECLGWRKYKKCKHWIDNGNRFWCSSCHRIVTHIYCRLDKNMEAVI